MARPDVTALVERARTWAVHMEDAGLYAALQRDLRSLADALEAVGAERARLEEALRSLLPFYESATDLSERPDEYAEACAALNPEAGGG